MPAAVRVQLGAALADAAARDRRQPVLPDAAMRRTMARAARAAFRHAAIREAELSITLLDDAEIAAMNRDFLSHDGPTDVISFALYEEGEAPVGDVYIGLEQAHRQAETDGIELMEELTRLAVHGTLHVLGHDHPDGPDRMESGMWRIQESIVAQVLA